MSSAPTPRPKNTQALWWILGIMGGGLVLMIALGLLVAGVVMRHVNVKEDGGKVKIETPVGAIRVNSDEGHPTGLPIYPGATKVKSEGAAVEFSSNDGGAVGIAAEKYATSDSLEKVSAWYGQKLGPNFKREKPHSATHYVRGVSTRDADAVFVNDTDDGARVVAITDKYSGVEIELIRAGKKEIQ